MKLLKELKDRLEKGMETAGHKSQQMLEISRLSMKIKVKKEDIDRLYRRLGQAVSEVWESQSEFVLNAHIRELLDAIRDLKQQVEILEQELLDVKGKRACPACQTVIDKSLDTCPSCGKTFSVQEYVSSERPVHNRAHTPEPDSPRVEQPTSRVTSESQRTGREMDFREYTLPKINLDLSSAGDTAHSKPQTGPNSNTDSHATAAVHSQTQLSTGFEEIVVCPGCGIQINPQATRCDTCGEVFFQSS
ncbi:hypothetical protein JIR001_23980 [Polycladomyces abyssicola]|uniref:Zinc ribbon domain-containing protein n=1 Tax=Polycladomyces abyssicola TaxID=1125966 RepID=A0A8D5UIU4_9BACL|nr:hypothetical protein [Polycladomyces abyssicola]BCU82615.1 hypothetical protein JIR001_23980 [Polycladomyces abyssicola]